MGAANANKCESTVDARLTCDENSNSLSAWLSERTSENKDFTTTIHNAQTGTPRWPSIVTQNYLGNELHNPHATGHQALIKSRALPVVQLPSHEDGLLHHRLRSSHF
jgi:hypothetical protein